MCTTKGVVFPGEGAREGFQQLRHVFQLPTPFVTPSFSVTTCWNVHSLHVTPGFSADLVCFPVATGCHYQYFLSAMFQGHLPHMLNVTVHSVNSATAHSSTWTYLIASFIMLISLLFACNIQSRVVEGLGLCRSGSSPRERFTSWTGFSSPRPEWILQGFFPIFSLQPGSSPWWYHFILICSISFRL